MLICKTYKYRLYPTRDQEAKLTEWLDLNRELYNAALEERREAWKRAHKSITCYDQITELPAVKEIRPEYRGVYSQVLQDTLRRVDKAFQGFFRRAKSGQKAGYPRFQSQNRYDSFTYPQATNGCWALEGTRLVLSKLGAIKLKLHRQLEGTPKTITVRRDGAYWYVCFSCEVESLPLPELDTAVGIDLGLEKFAVLSTGEQIPNPRHLRVSEAKLKTAQQALSRCKRGSHRRERARRAVARQHGKIRRQRADALHKLSRRLVNDYGTIIMEDLRTANLSKRPKAKLDESATTEQGVLIFAPNGAAAKSGLNKSIMDAGWGLFQQMCAVKAESAGRHVLFVDPHYTSQICSSCGAIKRKELSERWHSCPCGCELDRDHNAAINILRLGRSQQAVSVCRSPAL